jgi:hypothetical protein
MRRGLIVVAPLLAALAGCGGGGHVDAGKVQRLVAHRYSVVESVPVRDVSCPSDVPNRRGATFTCRTGQTAHGPVEVVVTSQGGGRFLIVPALSADRLERLLLRSRFGHTTRVAVLGARCPNGVAYRAGGTLRCQVVLAGGERVPVLVRQLDNRGTVRFTVTAIIATEVEGDIARRLGGSPRVTCPVGIPIAPGRRFTCQAGNRRVSVVILNAAGDVRFTIPR